MSASDERVMQRPAADYVAGDLPAAEADAFADALDRDADLQQEVAFWERMREELPTSGRPANVRLPGPGLAAAVRRRAEATHASDDSPVASVIPWPSLAIGGWMLAAAAIVMLVVQWSAPGAATASDAMAYQPIGFDEHGHTILIGNNEPVARKQVDRQSFDQVTAAEHTPWLGLWTQPVDLQGFDREQGLQVQHVEVGSPAALAGLMPGDILLEFGECAMYSRHCISNAIQVGDLKSGDEAKLSYFSAKEGRTIETAVTIGH